VLQLEMERLSVNKDTSTPARERLQKIEKELADLKEEQRTLTAQWQSEKDIITSIQTIKEEMDAVNIEIQQAERTYDLAQASALKFGKLIELQGKLDNAEVKLAQSQTTGKSLLREEVTESDIAEIISKWTGIPLTKLVETEREKLLYLEDELHRRVIGQEEAVTAVAEAIQRSRAGLSDPNRPIASFIFLGPTGVGKTELAKTLANYLFDADDALIRIDMSEYMEKHAVSRLIGAPPGYVGYEEGGQLTESIRRRPYAVILFDEIEKAHPDVFNVLLQVLDDGRVTDSQGRTVDFKNTVIIMTSNIGSQYILDLAGDDSKYDEMKSRVLEALGHNFRPEFLNRIDDTIIFHSLQKDQLRSIVKIQITRLEKRLADRKLSLKLAESALDFLANVGYDPVYGARPLKRTIQKELETILAKGILRGDFKEGDTVFVEVQNDHLAFSRLPATIVTQ
jgi:ATP-dependent Clp protease ATP-binding subunit ClpB